MLIYVRTIMEERIELEVNPSDRIEDIKISLREVEDIPVEEQELIYSGKRLINSKRLSDYNIHDGDTLMLALRNDLL